MRCDLVSALRTLRPSDNRTFHDPYVVHGAVNLPTPRAAFKLTVLYDEQNKHETKPRKNAERCALGTLFPRLRSSSGASSYRCGDIKKKRGTRRCRQPRRPTHVHGDKGRENDQNAFGGGRGRGIERPDEMTLRPCCVVCRFMTTRALRGFSARCYGLRSVWHVADFEIAHFCCLLLQGDQRNKQNT